MKSISQIIKIYYFAIIYPFRFLFKYGNIPRVKTIVPILSCIFLYCCQNIFIEGVEMSSLILVIYFSLLILFYGVFDIYIFDIGEKIYDSILNLPIEFKTKSYLIYIVFIIVLVLFGLTKY